tara:strand:- start:27380 stop:27805 length:426 start_codon:yes stop_codon:yes gene_type:complete
MFILLKNKQRPLASVALSLFVGSWLLLLCQSCLAATDEKNHFSEASTEQSAPCHEPLTIGDDIDISEEHCLGACDCDEPSTTINGEMSPDSKGKSKYSQDIYAYTEPKKTLSNRAPPAYRISTMPEQAIFLLQQHFTVLLI